MNIVVIGAGDGGSNIADKVAMFNQQVWKARGFGILSGDRDHADVFAVNLADLYSLQHIPLTEDHTIQIGAEDGYIGRGAGKNNRAGAEQARRNIKRILSTVELHSKIFTADAVVVIGTSGGGTGSGSVSVITQAVKDHFKLPTYAMVILPFASELQDPDTMINTATCLKSLLPSADFAGAGDAQIILDNERFRRPTDPIGKNYELINERIASALVEICAVGSETNPRYIGLKLDANDLIKGIQGPTVIGDASVDTPSHPARNSWFKPPNSLRIHANGARGALDSKSDVEAAQTLVRLTLSNLSADVTNKQGGETVYDAEYLIWLLAGPDDVTTSEMQGAIGRHLESQMISVHERHGHYPNRRKDLHLTVVLSNLGSGAFLDNVRSFYLDAMDAIENTKGQQGRRSKSWEAVGEASRGLPEL